MRQSYDDLFVAITCKVILLKQLLLICFIYEKLKKKRREGQKLPVSPSIIIRIFGIFSLGHRLITETLPFD